MEITIKCVEKNVAELVHVTTFCKRTSIFVLIVVNVSLTVTLLVFDLQFVVFHKMGENRLFKKYLKWS